VRIISPRIALMVFISVSIVAAIVPLASAAQPTIIPSLGLWTTVQNYRFTGQADMGINTAQWKYDLGQGIFGTGEIQDYTNSTANVHLDGNGNLDLVALRNGQWTSGRIESVDNRFSAPQGGELSVSAAIEQPAPASGLGYWPAFWMLGPGQWPQTGEIDILEDVNALSENAGTLHCGNLTTPNSDGTTGPCHERRGLSSGLQSCSGCQTGYHVYGLTIDRRNDAAQDIRWTIDGHQYFEVTESQVGRTAWTAAVDHGFSIILDLAMGGTFPDSACGCTTPTAQTSSGGTMRVQYVDVSEWTPLLFQ
jgi:beta-glucanase (GH16 family)